MRNPKRKHTGLKVFLIIFLVIFIGVPAAVFGCLFHKEPIPTKTADIDVTNWMPGLASRAFDDTKTSGKMNIEINEETINNIICGQFESISTDVTQWVPGASIKFNEDHYVFTINLRAWFFESILRFKATAEFIHDETDPYEDFLKFTITDYQVGNLPGLGWLAHFVFDKMNLQSQVESAISDIGLHMNVDLMNDTLTYKVGDALDDVLALMGGDPSSLNIQYYLLTEFLSQGLFDADFYTDKSLSVFADLSELGENRINNKLLNLDIDNRVKSRVKTLVDNQAIAQEDAYDMFTYFIYGYDYVNSDTQTLVDNTDFSSISPFFDKTGYQGFTQLHEGVPLDEVVENQITGNPEAQQKLINGEDFAYIDESDIDKFMRGTNVIVGMTTILDRFENDDYVLNYIVINDIYTDITSTNLDMYLQISFNGYPVDLVIYTTLEDSNTRYSVDYDISEILIGTKEIEDDLIEQLLSLVEDSFGSDGAVSYIPAEPGTSGLGKLRLDFEDSLDASYKTIIETSNKKIKITHDAGTDGNGKINVGSQAA